LVLMVGTGARGQLEPERAYYGVDRTIPMTVTVPEGAEGEARIELYAPEDLEEAVDSSSVVAGRVDLAGLFPRLWGASEPELLYAQLVVGEREVGAPVVLHPLVTPRTARMVTMADESGRARLGRDGRPLRTVEFTTLPPRGVMYSGLRAYVDELVVLETTEGEIRIRMRPEEAPNTVWNFRSLVEGGFYTDIDFHRVVPGFVVQAGDPTGLGSGGPGYRFDLEPSELAHEFGVISMARSTDPNSNGSQFFLCLSRQATQGLDGDYTAFGRTVAGAEVIEAIAGTRLDGQGKPVDPPRIVRARLVEAPPIGSTPEPVSRPGEGEGGGAR